MKRRELFRGAVAAGIGSLAGWSPIRGDDEPADRRRGRLFAYARPDVGPPELTGLIAIDPETGDWEKLADEVIPGARVSPDGRTLAMARPTAGADGSEPGVWLIDLGGATEPRRVFERIGFGTASWSSDNKNLLVCTRELVDAQVSEFQSWIVPTVGEAAPRRLDILESDLVLDWSPDAQQILSVPFGPLTDGRPTESRPLQLRNLEGGEPVTLHVGDGTIIVSARFLPDGKSVVCTTTTSARTPTGKPLSRVLRIRLAEGKVSEPEVLFDGEGIKAFTSFAFSPDGKRLALTMLTYEPFQGGLPAPGDVKELLWLIDPDGNDSREVEIPMRTLRLLDWR